MLDSLRDKLLILKLKNGDTDAFSEVYDRYAVKIYRFIFFKVNSVEEAEDLTSEVFLRLWQYLKQEERELTNLNAFIYQIARNLVIDHYRRLAGRESVSLDSPGNESKQIQLVESVRGLQLKIFEQAEFEQQFGEIKKALSNLKEEYREVLLLRYVEDFSGAEIAKIIKKSNGATRVLLHRAVAALKEVLDKSQNNEQSTNNQQITSN